jgi:hypothetical protein
MKFAFAQEESSLGKIQRHNGRKGCGARRWKTQGAHQLRINSRRRRRSLLMTLLQTKL